jgi:hypothetical protein
MLGLTLLRSFIALARLAGEGRHALDLECGRIRTIFISTNIVTGLPCNRSDAADDSAKLDHRRT